MHLSPRFDNALSYAHQLHRYQERKGTKIPYFAHLLGVASLVLEHSGNEDEAIAALLHDAVEDQGGLKTLEEIRRRFGDQVADIVRGCTDSYTIPKPPWRNRKEAYLLHLNEASPEVMRVSLADKLYNARRILADLRAEEGDVWARFSGGKEGTLWYYRALVEKFREVYSQKWNLTEETRETSDKDKIQGLFSMISELDRVVSDIEKLATMDDRSSSDH